MAGSKPVIGVYGSPQALKAYGLAPTEHYAKPSLDHARKAAEHGLRFIPVLWVPEATDPRQGVVNIYGETTLFAFHNSGCIANPALRTRITKRVEEAATTLDADTIILDALRYPSPHDGPFLFTCFCPYCSEAMRSQGINTEDLKSKLKLLAKNIASYPHIDPALLEAFTTWLRLRQQIVADTLEIIKDTASQYGVKLWAAVFPPSLAWLVGQNYELLKHHLEEIHVMLYHTGNGPACLNHELACLANLLKNLGADSQAANTITTMLTGIHENHLELDHTPLPPTTIITEATRSHRLLGEKHVPMIWLDRTGLEEIAVNLPGNKIAFLAP